ncbi:MAG: hypothetical protein A2020_07785 [Lentisphaerae bacterium GWF2_45_14]|nr:MAG: hypothetical protein A2020_07785 [Lentisphaerae bacterium GWF2_45_14]
MNIKKCIDAINACRFCFMCRHLDPVGNVTFNESDTPRGRALIIDKIRMDRENLNNQDFINTMYKSALSAANRYHCVSHYDEAGLVLAVRKDIVEAGLAPEAVKKLAKELEHVDFKVEGKGSNLYFGEMPELYPDSKLISGGDPGKALEVLGFTNESKNVFEKFKKAVINSKCETLIVAEPSSYDFLKNKFDNIKVIHSSEYLLSAGVNSQTQSKAYYLDSDYLKNYNDNLKAPRELLESAGYKLAMFGTNQEESYSVGEGAVVYDKLYPELAKKLAERVWEQADNPETDLIITASSYTKSILKKYNPAFNVITVEEAVLKAKGN